MFLPNLEHVLHNIRQCLTERGIHLCHVSVIHFDILDLSVAFQKNAQATLWLLYLVISLIDRKETKKMLRFLMFLTAEQSSK